MKSPVVLSLAALAACEGAFVPPAPYPPPPPAVASIRVTPDSGTVIAGDTLALTALAAWRGGSC